MCHLHTCTTYRATYSCTDRHSHTCHTCHTAADIFGALARGYVVCVAGRGEIKSDLGGCLTSLAVTHVCCTPALWRSVCLCAWEEGREGREGAEGDSEGVEAWRVLIASAFTFDPSGHVAGGCAALLHRGRVELPATVDLQAPLT